MQEIHDDQMRLVADLHTRSGTERVDERWQVTRRSVGRHAARVEVVGSRVRLYAMPHFTAGLTGWGCL